MGLGEEFARQLARRGVNLLLTARSTELLETISRNIRDTHNVSVEVLPCDLAAPDATKQISEWVGSLPPELRPSWLINNAGFGFTGPFEAIPPERTCNTLLVNAVALSELTSYLIPTLKQAPHGSARIINIGSVAGFQPIPWFAVYAATKAYVLSFSEALAVELKPHGIRVTCICPGPTRTQFGSNNEIDAALFEKGLSAEAVVGMALRASDRGHVLCITTSRLQTFAIRFVPRCVVRRVAGYMVSMMARKTGRSL